MIDESTRLPFKQLTMWIREDSAVFILASVAQRFTANNEFILIPLRIEVCEIHLRSKITSAK